MVITTAETLSYADTVCSSKAVGAAKVLLVHDGDDVEGKGGGEK